MKARPVSVVPSAVSSSWAWRKESVSHDIVINHCLAIEAVVVVKVKMRS